MGWGRVARTRLPAALFELQYLFRQRSYPTGEVVDDLPLIDHHAIEIADRVLVMGESRLETFDPVLKGGNVGHGGSLVRRARLSRIDEARSTAET